MAKADIDLIDETFDTAQSESYHLSIQTDTDRLSFCIFNTVINRYVVLRNYSLSTGDTNRYISECKSVFDNDELLRLKYKSSSHLLVSQRCTLVPEHLFADDEADLFLNFNHGTAAGEKALHNHVARAGLYNVFSYPEELIALLKSYQPDIKLFHHATPFLKSVMEPPSVPPLGGGGALVAVSYYSGYLDIGIVENNRLAFYNTFQINAPADSVYYLLVASDLFNIDLKATKLIYSGNNEQTPPEIAILAEYTGGIVSPVPSNDAPSVAYSHCIAEPLRKTFINLFNLYWCE
jgi:hypothetical protein